MKARRRFSPPWTVCRARALEANRTASLAARLICAACPARRAPYEVAKVDQVTVAAWLACRRATLRKHMSASKHRVDVVQSSLAEFKYLRWALPNQ